MNSGNSVWASVSTEAIRQRMEWVRENAEPALIPIQGEPLNVSLALDLSAIREVDISRGEVEILAVRNIGWKNPSFSWLENESLYKKNGDNTIHSFSMDIKSLWTPDIVAFNAVHAPELLSPPIANVAADGAIFYAPNERIRFRCKLGSFESTEGTNCTLKYGSWTYHGLLIHLTANKNDFTKWNYEEDERFDLLGTYVESETKYYPCCTEPYPDVKFILNIRKKS